MDNIKIIELKETILDNNDADAAVLRETLKGMGIYYINVMSPYWLSTFSEHSLGDQKSEVEAEITYLGKPQTIKGSGNGLLDAFVDAFSTYTGVKFSINMYNEHAMENGTTSAAITYIEIKRADDGQIFLGAGVSKSVTKSSVRAVLSAFNRMIK